MLIKFVGLLHFIKYQSISDVFLQDELLWGAAWLRRASQEDSYLNYIETNGETLGAEENINEFGWDNKHAGINVLVSKVRSLSDKIRLIKMVKILPSQYKTLVIVSGSPGRKHVLTTIIQSLC